jgi:DNA-binding MarR family transcriptional regulator
MTESLPLSALLSQALVAFIIEFDNEFEHLVPHRTTEFGATPGGRHAPWLVSMALWTKFLRFVSDEGIPVHDLQRLTQSDSKSLLNWLTRLSAWWGYLVIEPADPRKLSSSAKKLDPYAIVRPTPGGRKAIEAWRPLSRIIEDRWHKRFGRDQIGDLVKSLNAIAARLNPTLPDSLPILGYGLNTYTPEKKPTARKPSPPTNHTLPSDLSLPALLSKVLLAFAIAYEQQATISLAISANVLRLVGEGVPLHDLPRLSGVSQEAVANSQKFLVKLGYAAIEQAPTSRTKLLRLTPKGRLARSEYPQITRTIEEHWQTSYGKALIGGLRKSLEQSIGDSTNQAPLFAGLEPHPDNWRARVPKPQTLPHFPMILHRGGFPDGS